MSGKPTIKDVLVIGGGPAGLSAALYLGRARKSVVVLDRGNPRHAPSEGVHNFLTREGIAPAALRTIAWEQMAAYPTVSRHEISVDALKYDGKLWHATSESGEGFAAPAVVLATGMVDENPSIPGFDTRWAHSIHHYPFCHGWEMQDRPLAALCDGAAAAHYAPLLHNWSDDVVLLTGGAPLPDEARATLVEAKIPIYESPVVGLEGAGRNLERIQLADGTTLERTGLFVKPTQHQCALITQVGVELNDSGFVAVDAQQATSLPMLWAAGDLCSGFQQVVGAAAQGALAGAMIVATFTRPPA